jgi:hypothetical protein
VSRTPAVRARSPILLALAAAALAACTSKEPPPACPRVAVVGAAASLTRFAAGPGRDLTDVDFQASIVDLVSACRDTGTRGAQPMAKLMVAPVLVIDRGPANTSRQASFAYFVSVVDPDQRILNKQTFPVAVGFPGNRNRVVLRDDDPPIFVDVPNPQGAGAREYEILVGIQLDQSEIDYNLRQAGGGTPAGALIREPGPIE